MATPSPDQILAVLRGVEDPDLQRDIVTLGAVKDVRVEGDRVAFTIELGKPSFSVRTQIVDRARAAVQTLGVSRVDIKTNLKIGVTPGPQDNTLEGVKNLVAVASGKGGVGKSTVAVNLAMALQQEGAATGLMDADIYGPSIPIMMGTREQPHIRQNRIVPIESHGLRMMSIGFLAGQEMPVIWRGPMVHKMVTDFLNAVAWGELDYLVIDLPPGTGDAQLTLTQAAPLSGAVIVTTPQDVALEDVHRGVAMFEKVKVPILGVVENMSYFACPKCNHREEIFAHGGGKRAAEKYGVPFLGEIPILPNIRKSGDRGLPVVAAEPNSPAAAAFRDVAQRTAAELARLSMQRKRKLPTIKFS